jgi:branched-chain amino acid transport system substrate-binding protein
MKINFVSNAFAGSVLALIAMAMPLVASAQAPKLKVGLMLPATGTFAALGNTITNGFKLAIDENGGKLGGREVEIVSVDDESDPAKAPENTSKLIKRDGVEVLVGSVHSGVAMGMAKVARENNTLLMIPNAGADDLTGALCAPNIFRSSFTNWQPGFAMGRVMTDPQFKKTYKTAVTLTWRYAAGEQSVAGFREAFEKGGGKVLKEMSLPFPQAEFQTYLTEIAALKPDAVYVFFAGAGAVKFVKDYAAAGLKKSIPLYSPGFLTDGTLEAQGESAQGLVTVMHYADGLNNAKDKAFRAAYFKKYKLQPDVYAVQGYDAAQLLNIGISGVSGHLRTDALAREQVIKAMEKAKVDSPRGAFSLSAAHNPVQDMYVRQVTGLENKPTGMVIKSLADPARGCKLAP